MEYHWHLLLAPRARNREVVPAGQTRDVPDQPLDIAINASQCAGVTGITDNRLNMTSSKSANCLSFLTWARLTGCLRGFTALRLTTDKFSFLGSAVGFEATSAIPTMLFSLPV